MKTYLVGGAVRDKFLGLVPKDRDWVIVGATPATVELMLADGFSRVGADFPVFLHPSTGEEYALARVERKVSAGYHGFIVEADSHVTIEQDLARRDLTINSMALGDDGALIDPFNGLGDLHNHVLRHTTAAFAEDPLRVLRLARFAARFKNFTIAPETVELCRQISASGELDHLSQSRIWTELEKGLREGSPCRFMEILSDTHALAHCTVLRRAFGLTLSDRQRKECRALLLVDGDERLTVGAAVLAPPGAELIGAANRTLECFQNLQALHRAEYTVQAFYALLKSAGALRQGQMFNDLVLAATVLEMSGDHKFNFTTRQLMTGALLIGNVRAQEFIGVTGRELGQAIDAQRLKNLECAMGIPKRESTASHT